MGSLCAAALAFSSPQTNDSNSVKPLDGITFAAIPGHLYAPVREIGHALGVDVTQNGDSSNLEFDGHAITGIRHLYDGTGIMPVGELRDMGASINWDEASSTATISYKNASTQVHQSDKTVIVDKSSQSLMAYQGGRLILATHVSTGREGHGTPNGHFNAGPAKERMHRSRLYNFAPMPWSVQVDGNVFIHGYTSVPNRPASHGCIRMPLTRGNPARYFFNWVDVGTPVTIQGTWGNRFASRSSHLRTAYRHHGGRHRTRIASRRHRSSRWAKRRVHPGSSPSNVTPGPTIITSQTPSP